MVYLINLLLVFSVTDYNKMQEQFDYEIEPIGFYTLVESEIENGYVHIMSVSDEKEGKPKYLIYVVKSTLGKAIGLEELREKENIQTILKEVDATKESEVTLKSYSNTKALTFEASMKSNNKALVYLTTRNTSLYKILFISREEGFENYKDEFNKCLDTFKVFR